MVSKHPIYVFNPLPMADLEHKEEDGLRIKSGCWERFKDKINVDLGRKILAHHRENYTFICITITINWRYGIDSEIKAICI